MLIESLRRGYAVTDVEGDGFRLEAIFFVGDDEAHDAGLAVEGLRGVEDEVADAVVDGFELELLDGLQGVGMMADEGVGPCEDQLMSLVALTGHRLKGMLTAPMERDEDNGCGVSLSEAMHTL